MGSQKRANKKRNCSERSQPSGDMETSSKKPRSVKDLLEKEGVEDVVTEPDNSQADQVKTPKSKLDFDSVAVTPNSSNTPQWALDLIASVNDLKTEIGRLSSTSSKVNKLTRRIESLERENTLKHSENEELREKILNLEYHQRRNNLVFYGIDECDGPENGRDCYNKIMHYISGIPDIDANSIRIDRCHRLGPKVQNRCRGIIARFNWYGDLVDVLGGCSFLPRGIYVTEDYPDEWLERRRLLKPILHLARNNPKYKYKSKLVKDKLIIDGKQFTIAPRNNLHELPVDLTPADSCEKRDKSTIAFLGPHSVFSNFHPARFSEGGVQYTCAEQMIQAEKAAKFGDKVTLERIVRTKDLFKIKEIGGRVRGFDKDAWKSSCKEIALHAIHAKFSQNMNLSKLLVSTGSLLIVESSPDKLWGTGVHLKMRMP